MNKEIEITNTILVPCNDMERYFSLYSVVYNQCQCLIVVTRQSQGYATDTEMHGNIFTFHCWIGITVLENFEFLLVGSVLMLPFGCHLGIERTMAIYR